MDLDSKGLSRLHRVADPRDVWRSESGDFTPWLAENIDVLAEQLRMTLTVVGTEVPVGDFRLDILAEDDSGRYVAIENQLEKTDHGHLGQCLLYASGLDAATVVWVAPRFRDEFRRAFDWLNERTDLGINFFGVEISLVQMGEGGPIAPVCEVVARPNDWQKETKATGSAASGSPSVATPLNAQRQQFFQQVLTLVNDQLPSVRIPTRGRTSWMSFANGPWGNWSVSVAKSGELRLEAYLDPGDRDMTKELFDSFRREAERWEEATGTPLTWERTDNARASRITVYQPAVDLADEETLPERAAAAASVLVRMYRAMDAPLRERIASLRARTAASSKANGPVSAESSEGL